MILFIVNWILDDNIAANFYFDFKKKNQQLRRHPKKKCYIIINKQLANQVKWKMGSTNMFNLILTVGQKKYEIMMKAIDHYDHPIKDCWPSNE